MNWALVQAGALLIKPGAAAFRCRKFSPYRKPGMELRSAPSESMVLFDRRNAGQKTVVCSTAAFRRRHRHGAAH
jgi:hypothetical protein